jgi:hypothetical protein
MIRNSCAWGCYRDGASSVVLLHTYPGDRLWRAWPVGTDRHAGSRPLARAGHLHWNNGVRYMEATKIDTRVKVQPDSTLTCPYCGHRETETMPTDSCQWFCDCKGCGEVLKPKQGDCCVYCSYGTVPCPPIQEGACCGGRFLDSASFVSATNTPFQSGAGGVALCSSMRSW